MHRSERRAQRYEPGTRVTHAAYGDGTVTLGNEYHTRITFDAHGERTFISQLVVLTPATTAAPAPKAKRPRQPRAAK